MRRRTTFVTAVDQVRQPFFCNAAAQAAAIEALKHSDAVAERVERDGRRADRDRGRACASSGIEPAESQANFVLVRPARPTATSRGVEGGVVDGLAERGVLVRAGSALGRAGALRVTYGTPQQNERFLAALGELLCAPDAGSAVALAATVCYNAAAMCTPAPTAPRTPPPASRCPLAATYATPGDLARRSAGRSSRVRTALGPSAVPSA